jgi:hypothetical protein
MTGGSEQTSSNSRGRLALRPRVPKVQTGAQGDRWSEGSLVAIEATALAE